MSLASPVRARVGAALVALALSVLLPAGAAAAAPNAKPTPSPSPSSSSSPSSPSAKDVAKAKAQAKADAAKLDATRKQLIAVQAQLDAQSKLAEVAVAQWQAAQARARAAQGALDAAQQVADAADAKLAGYRQQLNDYAVAAYMDGGPVADLAALLNASNPADVLTRNATLQAIGRGQMLVVQAFVGASNEAAAARETAAGAAADAQQAAAATDTARAVASTAVAMAQELLAKVQVSKAELTAKNKKDKTQVDSLVAARAAALAAARAAAARAASLRLQQLATVTGFPEATPKQGELALQWAKTQLGVPYSWGGGDASGPTLGFVENAQITAGASTIGFDCSGLTLFAWAHAGYALGHYTGAQWVEGTAVSQDQVRPGDLVFFATDITDPTTIHHVGIYAGNGKMIDAPETGSVVRYDDAFGPGYIGAIRP